MQEPLLEMAEFVIEYLQLNNIYPHFFGEWEESRALVSCMHAFTHVIIWYKIILLVPQILI